MKTQREKQETLIKNLEQYTNIIDIPKLKEFVSTREQVFEDKFLLEKNVLEKKLKETFEKELNETKGDFDRSISVLADTVWQIHHIIGNVYTKEQRPIIAERFPDKVKPLLNIMLAEYQKKYEANNEDNSIMSRVVGYVQQIQEYQNKALHTNENPFKKESISNEKTK